MLREPGTSSPQRGAPPDEADGELHLGDCGYPQPPAAGRAPARVAGRRAPVTRATTAALLAVAVLAGLIAGFEEGRRRLESEAIAATTVFAWVSGFDGTGAEGTGPGAVDPAAGAQLGRPIRLQLRLATTGGLPLTVTDLTLSGEQVRLVAGVSLVPAEVTATAALVHARCPSRAEDSGVIRDHLPADRARVLTADGRSHDVEVRRIAGGVDAVIDSAACADVDLGGPRATG